MVRSKWKNNIRLRKSLKLKKGTKIFSRTSCILEEFVGKIIKVHKGNGYITIRVTPKMIGHKFGEFAPTRKPFSFKKKR